MNKTFSLPGRQVHLDFHTSPLIPDMLIDFDPEVFADTLQDARVNSVTVFAKCHHGMSYYPTRVGEMHPYLSGYDLLGHQLDALKHRGIGTLIYTTVAWEERLAALQPQWHQIKQDGTFARQSPKPGAVDPDKWQFLCFNNPDYQEYFEEHLRELLDAYKPDGFWFDIVFYHQDACFCDYCIVYRKEHGLLDSSQANHALFQEKIKQQFAERVSKLVRSHQPKARYFFNSNHYFSTDSTTSVRGMNPHLTHWELESLPSGFWGYQHFPRFARHVETFEKPWLGMTGRFQRMWGDFGGIKPKAALEFECFRTQGHGGANSVGDQLPPRGRLDPAAYDLIGYVYKQVEAAEPFYEASEPLSEIGVLLAGYPGIPATEAAIAEEGAVLMLEESHYNAHVLDDQSDLSGYTALVLPDSTVITDQLYESLKVYYHNGGKLILSFRAGCDAVGQWRLDFLPVKLDGESLMSPTYWRTTETFWSDVRESDRVFYEAGMEVQRGEGTHVLVERVHPYFKRTDSHFMSHFQAPPMATPDPYPAVIAGERFVYFADPLFSGYRQHGSTFHRDVFERVLSTLVGPPRVGKGLGRTILSLPRRRGNDLIVTLLHYVPVRKALEVDVIEEAASFAGEVLRFREISTEVSPRFYGGEALELIDTGAYALPPVRGRILIECNGYFHAIPESQGLGR